MSAVYESVRCNLCGADDPAVLLDALPESAGAAERQYAASGDSPLRDRLVRCKRCSLVYVSPRLKQATIEAGYEHVDNTVYVEQGSGRLETFKHALSWIEQWGIKKGRVLDVGCAGGFFVKAAQDAGWDATGLELSQHLCDYGRKELGVNIVQGTLEQATFPEQSFDMVTFWDVLEHVSDPADALRRAKRLLKPQGTLVVNYPDYSSIWAKLLRRRWWFLIDVHIYYFTPHTLELLLRRNGFSAGQNRMHFQTLPLGYVTERVGGMFPRLGRSLNKLVLKLGLQNVPLTYYASQQTLIAYSTHGVQK